MFAELLDHGWSPVFSDEEVGSGLEDAENIR
jgi:hypothetical protein